MLFVLSPSPSLGPEDPEVIFSMSGAVLPAQSLMSVSRSISGSDLIISISSNSLKPYVAAVNCLLQLSCRLAVLVRNSSSSSALAFPTPASSLLEEPFVVCSKALWFVSNLKARNTVMERGKTEEKMLRGSWQRIPSCSRFLHDLDKSLIMTESFGYCCRTSDNNVH